MLYWVNSQVCRRKEYWPNLIYNAGVCDIWHKEKNHEQSQRSLSPYGVSNQGPSEHKARRFTTWPRSSVSRYISVVITLCQVLWFVRRIWIPFGRTCLSFKKIKVYSLLFKYDFWGKLGIVLSVITFLSRRIWVANSVCFTLVSCARSLAAPSVGQVAVTNRDQVPSPETKRRSSDLSSCTNRAVMTWTHFPIHLSVYSEQNV
jgi:hypothetical protein